MKEKEKKPSFPIGKINMAMMAVCLLLIVVGFWLMTGSANEGDKFNYAIFESRRTTIGPMMALLGFVLMAPAILWRPKCKCKNDGGKCADASNDSKQEATPRRGNQ